MSDDTLAIGALFVCGGVAGYALGHWALARGFVPTPSPQATTAPTPSTAATASPTTPPTQARRSPAASRPTAPDVGDGPITSPAQVDPAPAPTAPAATVDASSSEGSSDHRASRRYDRIFDRHRGAIPIEYLRALAKRESDMNPLERSGPGWGLLQIIEVVRVDYIRAHRYALPRERLLDPELNVAVACWLLRSIIASYHRHHPDVPNLRADWDNSHFVELLTFGWNAGFSERGGVGRVARHLEARGETDMTIDLVHEHARAAGASRHLSNARKVAWCKGVARLYQRERAQ